MNTRVFRASFKRLLKCNPHCEPSYGTAEQNKAYVSKGDVLTKGDIINLPDELEGKVINEPVVFEKVNLHLIKTRWFNRVALKKRANKKDKP